MYIVSTKLKNVNFKLVLNSSWNGEGINFLDLFIDNTTFMSIILHTFEILSCFLFYKITHFKLTLIYR